MRLSLLIAGAIGALAAAVGILALADADLTLFFIAKLRGVPGGAYSGQVVWITGASSGIGEGLAYEFARTNATLVLSARRVDRLQEVLERCKAMGASKASIVEPLDVVASVETLGAAPVSLAADMPLSTVRRLFELNFFAAIEHARAAVPALEASGGQIVLTSSFSGKLGTPAATSYSATKHALHGYFGGMRAEVAKNVDITIVCPGPVSTHAGAAANKMPRSRAVQLMLASIYYRLSEAWISEHPPLLLLYVGQYFPRLASYLVQHGPGRSRVQALKAGIDLFSSEAYTLKAT